MTSFKVTILRHHQTHTQAQFNKQSIFTSINSVVHHMRLAFFFQLFVCFLFFVIPCLHFHSSLVGLLHGGSTFLICSQDSIQNVFRTYEVATSQVLYNKEFQKISLKRDSEHQTGRQKRGFRDNQRKESATPSL